MDKLKMSSSNIVNENIDFIASRFPNVIVEIKDENGKIVKAVDFDILKQELSSIVVDGDKERYTMTWPDKKQAILTANAPIAKTLRPCVEESVGKDGTNGEFNSENLYIEGDNLDVLKLLRETYLGQIKMIYIDPPYNTGNDFVYNDDFATDTEDYLIRSNQVDEEGNRMVANNDSNGRFHTDWLNMIYPRLRIAKDLLSNDGVIFISIDDNEVENLRKICDEILGSSNFIATLIWKKKYGIQNDAKFFSCNHDYIVVYCKDISQYQQNLLPRTAEQNSRYKNPDNDPRGPWKAGDMSVGRYTEKDCYEVITPSGRKVLPPSGNSWRLSYSTYQEYLADNRIWFGANGDNVPAIKRFLSEVKDGTTSSTIWEYEEVGHTDKAKKELNVLFDGKALFDYPKSVDLLKKMLRLGSNNNSIILDFFSGSATTAHAVMQLNAEDNGSRKFIMVQLPEIIGEKSEVYKVGYKNICEIGKERIRRAGKKIQDENGLTATNLDIGFRVLKLDSSCMKDVYYNPADIKQDLLAGLEDNIKEDRTAEDLLFQVMLDMGVLLSSEIKVLDIKGKKVFNVNDGNLICCFDKNLTEEVVTEIAQLKPLYAVFRDSSMSSDSVAVNFDQIFETYSPTTTRKII